MKTQITTENKARFFAQYWGQPLIETALLNKQNAPVEGYPLDNNNILKNCFLELRPLSAITDEDAIEVAYLNWPDMRDKSADINMIKTLVNTFINNIKIYQYLQSRGYALPWMGLSVDEMVEAGWIKLIP